MPSVWPQAWYYSPMNPWPRILKAVGVGCILVGSLDPVEGSLLIAPGSGLLALASHLGREDPRVVREWFVLFGLMAFGVIQVWELSQFGGLGGQTGVSMWWGLLVLPYPVAWILTLVRLGAAGIAWLRRRSSRGIPAD